jgi:arylsulfatase
METIDDDTVDAAKDFIRRQHAAGTPFFVWMNTTHMHLRTHTKPESVGQAGRWQSPYHDTMIDHDKHVGGCSTCWTSSASPTTPSSSTPPTTAPT